MNADLNEIQTKFNTYAVQTDVAKTITASHTFTPTAGVAFTVTAGGISVAGASVFGTINGQTVSATASLTGTLAVAGAVTLSGGVTVTGGSGITGTLATAAQPNITSVGVLASPHLTGAVVDSGGLTVTAGGVTVTAGGAAITGNSTVTGNLNVTGTLTGAIGIAAPIAMTSDFTTTSATPGNTALSVALGASQTYRVDVDLAVSCNNTGGVVLQFTVPAGTTGRVMWMGATSSATALTSASASSFGSVANWSTFNSTTNPVYVRVALYVSVGVTPGNLVLQCSSVTGTQTSTVYTGSSMNVVRIS